MGKCRATSSEKPPSIYIEEEEGELFLDVRGSMGRSRRKELGEQMAALKGHAHRVTRAFAPASR